ncbi:MAG: Smr/MutS family protein [Sphaerochaetaceae bacterium]|nr:Smr/MutS family protein [Sphaerochaetaceae bacterium]
MIEKTLEDLQFNVVLSDLRSRCLSEEGQLVLDKKEFITDIEQLKKMQDIVEDIESIYALAVPSPESFPSIAKAMQDVRIPQRSLEGQQLWDIATYLHSARIFVEFCHTPALQQDSIRPASTLFDEFPEELAELGRQLFEVLESPGHVKESHPAIRALKKEVERKRSERQSYSSEFMRTQYTIVQGEQPVFRDGRIVLPIRNDQKGAVEGFVHSTSASGATVFVEPFRLVELNNKVILAEQQILLEIAKILKGLTDTIRSHVDVMIALRDRVAQADALHARYLYARDNHCIRAKTTVDGQFKLLNARHPLLRKKAVPISLELDKDVKAVIISGPNAGGKTVTIKTLGLFALMNQFFYMVPACEGTSLPLYRSIYTDIGDDQSIEASLSTFSGHMKNISHILSVCDKDSLVILDELGSGTDPVEGSAIARAVLEFCVEHANLTLVSSHHGVLKQYAYAHPNVINASMEFDDATHAPTFNVITGIPGDSHALETAKRMRLPTSVIDAATEYIGSEQMEISTIIRHLETRRKEAEAREEALEKRWAQLHEEVRENDLKRLQLRQHEMLLRRQQIGDLSRFIADKRSELENLVAELREGEITKEKTKKVKLFIKSLEIEENKHRLQAEQIAEELIAEHEELDISFSVGMDVLAGPSKREGRIVREAGKGTWVVAIGPMKFTLAERDLKPISKANRKAEKVSIAYQSSSVMPKPTLDVRGLTLQEALDELSVQIESALVHAVSGFSIIHGMGEGILAKGIHEYLSSVPQVSSYNYARPEDGGFGKTYVEL